jgi:CDP-4-dehydro-6-deoxyglucose reductase, E1
MYIPYAQIIHGESERANVLDVLDSFHLARGKWSDRFEREFADWLGTKYAKFVNSGSSANLLAVAFPTTVAPLVQHGLVPVFVDIDETYNIDPSQLSNALSNKTRAVMLAHTLGNPFNIAAVQNFCDDHGLWLIEDNCDALGSTYGGQKTGTFGDIATSSFYPAHHMTTGEGGMVYTDDSGLARIVQRLRDWGRDCTCNAGQDGACGKRFDQQHGSLPQEYVYSEWGYNLKPSEFEAALGCAQLERLDSFVEARRNNWLTLRDMLPVKAQRRQFNSNPSWFGFLMSEDTLETFEKAGVQSRRLFAGNITRHPCMKNTPHRVIGGLPMTDISMSATWIGVGPHLTPDNLAYMGSVL